ncbi:Phosphoesterase PA-phosphatase-like protein [Frankia canadensis]|uniref:Phosphoesterase PA-phosphatase-like protein n=1 Tax=Frankia canadensis TaxID=1836972 RepID=A0A2I2KLP1_9ACTN|nr:phosphatase PAP2 family protein [Frankia canadensis]SNQ46581.1 Phosphoesterase PA-phosphatase-like protein [Frankia canadensis]SOU53871.1 Phosphoesterase PA-phosphatase-like protein [Frankia canadensis]
MGAAAFGMGPGGRRRLVSGVAVVAAGALVALLVLAAGHDGGFRWELAVHRWALRHRARGLTDAAIAVTTTGSGVPAYALAALAGVLAAGRGSARARVAAVGAMFVLVAGQLVRFGLSRLIDRARPPAADWAWQATGAALPSGHTTTSALVAAGLAAALLRHAHRRGTRIAAVALPLAWACAVGLSRIYLGMHWPLDVAAGWLLATVLVSVTFPLLARAGRRIAPPNPPPSTPR